MKGVEPLIGAVLVIAITITAIAIAFQLTNPAIDRTKENFVFQEGKNNLLLIDNLVNEVVSEGNGSSRLSTVYVTDGEYFIFSGNDSISFVMETRAQIIGVGVSKIENGINITGYPNRIILFMDYDSIDLQTERIFGKGNFNLFVKSFGFDANTGKHIVNVTV